MAWLIPPPSLSRPRGRCLVEKSGDGLQATVGGYHAEIGAVYDRRSVLRREFPGESDTVVMGVDIARPAKPVSGEARLNPLDHGVDARLALAIHHGVEIACAFRPRL